MSEKKDLLTSVREWIDRQGYPLEMEVAKSFYDAKYSIRLSDYYEDPDTGKFRETDVIATQWVDFVGPVRFRIDCHIECKKTSKPWVVFVFPTQPESLFHPAQLISSQPFEPFVWEINRHSDFISTFAKLSLFQQENIAHGVALAHADQRKSQESRVPFQATMSAYKSAMYAVRQIDRYPPRLTGYISGLAFPIVVIDSELVECSMNENAEIKMSKVPMSAFYLKHTRPFRLVHIVTKAGLDQFIEYINEVANLLSTIVYENAETLKMFIDIGYKQQLEDRKLTSIG